LKKQYRIAVISGKYYNYLAKIDYKEAETFVLKSINCKHDGIISTNLNRYFSLTLSRFFSRFSITPNIWSFVTFFLGVLGAVFVWQKTFVFTVIGMFFIQISSIFSGIDGEIARMKFQKTNLGRFLNMLSNDFVTFLFLFSISFAKSLTFSFDSSNKILLIIYPIYIFMKYIDAFYSSHKLDPELFPVSKTGFYDSSSKIFKTLVSFIKRDFIIFSAFIFALFGKIEYFATIYLSLIAFFLLSAVIVFIKNFYKERFYD
jgi:phosphatidylglycerophosphate synthase